jgi:hypothetical protein
MAIAHRGTAGAFLWCHAASLLVGCVIAIHLLIPIASATSTGRVSGEYITSLFWSTLLDIAVIDSNAFCGTGLGLAVIDLSDPAHPKWKADYYLGAAGHHIVAEGYHVYLAHYSTIYIFDVSNASEPVLLSQLSLGGDLRAIAVSGGILVAADYWNNYIDIVDVADPNSPRVLGRHYTYYDPNGVAIHGTIVYAAIDDSTIQILDISDPAVPTVIGIDSAAVRSVVINYPYLYGFHPLKSDGLLVWNVADPAHPSMVFQDSGIVRGVLVNGDRAYVQDLGTLRILDVSDPTAPRTIAEKVHGGWPIPKAMIGSSGNLVALAGQTELRVIDVSDTVNVPEVARLSFDNFFTRLKAYKEWLFAVMRRAGKLHVFDIGSREMPALIGTMPELGPVSDFVIRNDTMYACGRGVRAVDVSDPQQPRVLGVVNPDTSYGAIKLTDTLVYVSRRSGLDVLSFSNAVNPTLVGTYFVAETDHTIEYGGGMLELDDHTAYMDGWIWDGRRDQKKVAVMIDISDPTAPTRLGRLEFPTDLSDLRVRSGIGYALEGSNYLYILDLDAPSGQPSIIHSVRMAGPNTRITLHEDMAYVGVTWGGIAVVDVSDPVRADTIGSYDPGAGGSAYLAVVDSFAYIAAGHGLVVAKLTISPAADVDDEVLPQEFSLAQNCPNPFNAGTSIRYSLPVAGTVTLSIFDVLGRHVITLADAAQSPGTHVVTWDGRTAQGVETGSGVYFYRLRFAGEETSRKMLLLK